MADVFRIFGNKPLTKLDLQNEIPSANRSTMFQYLYLYPEFVWTGDGHWKLEDEFYQTGKMMIGMK